MQNEKHNEEPEGNEQDLPKKSYLRPRLTTHGTVETLTEKVAGVADQLGS